MRKWWPHKLAGARRFCRRAPLQRISRPVSRVLYGLRREPQTWRPFLLHAGCPAHQATYPNGWSGQIRDCSRAVPIRSCSRWGLPCRFRRRKRGALLPHRFTLAAAKRNAPRRSVLCGTVPGPAPRGSSRRTLSGTVCPWSPDFPPRPPFGIGAGRPSGRLTG